MTLKAGYAAPGQPPQFPPLTASPLPDRAFEKKPGLLSRRKALVSLDLSMSTSPTPPDVFALNGRLIPVVLVLAGLLFSGLSAMCVLSAFHHRRLRNDPRMIALARDRNRLKGEVVDDLSMPSMNTVNMEIDLEVGEAEQRRWRTIMVRFVRCRRVQIGCLHNNFIRYFSQ
jgi:hypothetical protein